MLVAGAMAISFTACNNDDSTDPTPDPGTEQNVLTGEVTADKVLAKGTWTLRGYVYVKSGATLKIDPGTIIKSDVIDKGALIIERGAKIMAEGTAAEPIVFTSGVSKGQRRPGDWGGIIILGNAPTNRSTPPTIEGGVGKQYGGTDPNDNSGSLNFVRVEFAGIAAEPGSEINGISLGGVGKGTQIKNVMVSYGNDDAIEFFGGTVNVSNFIAFGTSDDDFDFDFGYTGTIDHIVSHKLPMFADAGDAANGIEADNDGSGTSATPFTHPVISYATFIGPNGAKNTAANHNLGNRWRRAVQFEVDKSIIMGHMKGGFSMESAETVNAYFAGTSKFTNNLVHSLGDAFITKDGGKTNADVKAKALADGCEEVTVAAIGLANPFDEKTPDYTATPGGKAATNGVGAMNAGNWATGWTNFDPNNTDY